MNKIFLGLAVLLVCGLAALVVVVRKAPDLLVRALESGLDKKVAMEGVRYRAPLGFEVRKLAVLEKQAFAGETSFYAENVFLAVNPAALLGGRIVIPEIVIRGPQITVRKMRGEVVHALSRPGELPSPPASPPALAGRIRPVAEQQAEAGRIRPAATRQAETAKPGKKPPVEISHIEITEGLVQWIDYDIAREGFVVQVQGVRADIRELSLDQGKRMRYEVEGRVTQGRERPSARVSGTGWTHTGSLDTDSNFRVEGLWIPYFEPYYRSVAYSAVESGSLNLQATAVIQNRDFTLNGRLGLAELVLAVGPGQELFGVDAAAVLDLLRNRSGQIQLDIIVRWDMKDPSVTFQSALRRSIEHSLKSSLASNIQTVVENTLDKVIKGDKDGLKDILKGLKEGFKD